MGQALANLTGPRSHHLPRPGGLTVPNSESGSSLGISLRHPTPPYTFDSKSPTHALPKPA
jgi:hypothetical protein